MAGDENSIIDWILKGGWIAAGAIGGWSMLNIRQRTEDAHASIAKLSEDVNQKIGRLTDNLSEYKLYLASTIPTKQEMNSAIADTRDSVKRIHEKVESSNNNIEDKFSEVRDDIGEIKNMLISRSHK